VASHVEVVINDHNLVTWADPGLLTGLASYDMKSDVFNSWQYNARDLRTRLNQLADIADGRMVLGYEKFIYTSGGPRTSTPEHAQRAIYVLEEFARERKVPVLPPQPSSARNLGQVVYLRRLGWYRPGKGHANDAGQHVLADLLKRRPIPGSIREKLFPGYTPSVSIAP
jgi:hypothetical protein